MSGIFHSQEWERFVGFMATVFGHERLSAQLARDAIQFTTRAHFGKVYEPRSSGGSMSQLFSKVKSPSTKGKARAETSVTADSFALDFDSEVPIYDARDVKFDFNEDLGRIDDLPRWDEEIPYGSFVVVGYTVAVFKSDKNRSWTISLNIHWAMVVGVPSP
ncbi:hypothetical protein BKA70DRAFT_1104774 [Coprinopsis sp. MPI-PUGE-AT-0042]|nr:hypothetical protein BKA70DRAFT_1379689 [Coprinopsis sp. MPI-PUGE-AT-0042]KAH6907403.1 hypothetical protein BKA70DRAFT_1104774 [Coprinopsis sp. MPI-PUGE-AT-0042]